jgi:hypothetical protein
MHNLVRGIGPPLLEYLGGSQKITNNTVPQLFRMNDCKEYSSTLQYIYSVLIYYYSSSSVLATVESTVIDCSSKYYSTSTVLEYSSTVLEYKTHTK